MNGEPKIDLAAALGAMLSHAAFHSPYYRAQDWAQRVRQGRGIDLANIPITPKALVKGETERFYCAFVPASEGPVRVKHTSGSTGEPMAIRKTLRHFRRNLAENRRLITGWGLAAHRRIAEIGFPDADHPIGTTELQALPHGVQKWNLYSLDADAAADLFRQTSATLALAYPSIMLGVLERYAETSEALSVRLIATVSEVVPDDLRELVRRRPDCRLMDMYGAVETGLIAAQCPDCDAYHPADRHLILELVRDDGRPAGPGEMGRVIATPLFNRAMPLVRYETGDYAVAARNTACPRSPYAIERVLGRESDLFKLPGGGRIAAMLPSGIAHNLGVRQFKLFQTSLDDIELHYVPRNEGVEIAETAAQEIVDRYLSPRFRIHCRRVSEISRAPGGKYIMHECLI